jgi:hypothetical protein
MEIWINKPLIKRNERSRTFQGGVTIKAQKCAGRKARAFAGVVAAPLQQRGNPSAPSPSNSAYKRPHFFLFFLQPEATAFRSFLSSPVINSVLCFPFFSGKPEKRNRERWN